MLAAIVLFALFQAQTDPHERARALIEKFRSDDVKERDAATAELTKLGEAVRKTLEAAAQDKDPEVASRVRDVLQALDRAAIRHPWGSFKPGSFARLKSITDIQVAGNAMKTEMTITYTIVEVTKEEAVVDIEMVMANVPPQKSQMKLPLEAPQTPPGDVPKPKTGTEEILVAGKKLKCVWTEIETVANGIKTLTRVYTHESVPGHTVKLVTSNNTMNHKMEVVEFSSK